MFSRRAQWDAPTNRLTRAREARGVDILDLTVSNPTRAGIAYPLDELSEAMARAARAPYDPNPRGILSAREALAEHLDCHPDELLLTASTSEAYSFLFKLLTDPGDAILTATPTYPLLEHLASLELIALHTFPLDFHARWEIDPARVHAALTPNTRAIVVVNPNNPTGSYVTESFPLTTISDEVFFDYPLEPPATRDPRPATFSLNGLSKLCGLPHYKLGWIRTRDREALNALELIADNFLSLATPVQHALPDLLRIGTRIRAAISARTRESLAIIDEALAAQPAARRLPVEGGWSAVIRVPRIESDEELALRLIEEHGVVVHPGYFFDFPTDGYFVVSLLTPPDILREALRRMRF